MSVEASAQSHTRGGTQASAPYALAGARAALPVSLSGVTKQYGKQRAVDAVSFDLYPGQCVVLAGHNGAGKSTLIKLILGLIRAEEGRVNVLGHEADSRGAAIQRRHIGYLPETVALYPSLTGEETLAFYARLKGLPTTGNHDLLARVGIAQAAKKRVGGYSKGMRQRLALAQALLGEPRLLLLDEPTTGLDPASRLLFYDIVAALRNAGAAILLSTHALAELESQADRVIVMQRGKKIADGTLSDLRRDAGLPVRLLLTLDRDLPEPPAGWQRAGERRLLRQCPENDKLAALREAQAIPGVVDIELEAPGLDEMYAHFLRREDV
ncbi:ATP-binding cassette domain-containing protein [Pusillimonas sp. TS35]|uniref:ABC transporter ATP-binding protein n=1 Tax=Paracandidimonas lactea TaxID=2895524 RepID=UPI00136C7C0B|nr:ABC transporter ATP-binding protein [Paracandidimonas lactea]MYN12810.1 ATP-binding cassette domain-containing protein [Pusillimonas sp. TS35]